MVDVEARGESENFITQAHTNLNDHPAAGPPVPYRYSDRSFLAVVMSGYSSAFVIHAGLAAWEIIRSQEASCPYPTPHGQAQLTDERLREGCERHMVQICKSIDELANDRFGMITSSPLLFLLDSAWIGYRALEDFCGYDLDEVRPWFMKIGSYVTSTGYRPLREPWLMGKMSAAMRDKHDVASV